MGIENPTEGEKMEAPKENPQIKDFREKLEEIFEEKKDYTASKTMAEDTLKGLKEAKERGESVDPEFLAYVEKKNDELRETVLGEIR